MANQEREQLLMYVKSLQPKELSIFQSKKMSLPGDTGREMLTQDQADYRSLGGGGGMPFVRVDEAGKSNDKDGYERASTANSQRRGKRVVLASSSQHGGLETMGVRMKRVLERYLEEVQGLRGKVVYLERENQQLRRKLQVRR